MRRRGTDGEDDDSNGGVEELGLGEDAAEHREGGDADRDSDEENEVAEVGRRLGERRDDERVVDGDSDLCRSGRFGVSG